MKPKKHLHTRKNLYQVNYLKTYSQIVEAENEDQATARVMESINVDDPNLVYSKHEFTRKLIQ